jgi:hypothetical protein
MDCTASSMERSAYRVWAGLASARSSGTASCGRAPPTTGVSSTHFSGDGARRSPLKQLLPRAQATRCVHYAGTRHAGIDWQMVGNCDTDNRRINNLGHLDYGEDMHRRGPRPVGGQLATLNNARHWRKEHEWRLAPGRRADILLSVTYRFQIDRVMAEGEIVAEGGRLTADIPVKPVSLRHEHNKDEHPLTAADFEGKSAGQGVENGRAPPFYIAQTSAYHAGTHRRSQARPA